MKAQSANTHTDLKVICGLAIAGVALFHLLSAAIGYPHFRDLHLGAAMGFAKDGIDLLNPVIVGFNATNTGTPQEIPLWQALASFPLRFSGWWGWANGVSLLCYLPAFWVLWRLGSEWMGERAGWWVLLAFVLQPVSFITSGQASADGLSVSFATLALFCMVRLVNQRNVVWWLAAAIFGILSACTKLPFFMAVGVAAGLYLLTGTHRNKISRWMALAAVGIVSAVALFGWTGACNTILARAEFPHVNLSLKDNPAMWRWYFGDWAYRLNPANYVKGGWAALNALFGSFALVGLAAVGLASPGRRAVLCLLGGALATLLVFSHLVLVHRHYFVIFSLPAALLVGAGLDRVVGWVAELWKPLPTVLATLLGASILGLSTIQGLLGMEIVLNYDPYPKKIADTVRAYVADEEKVLIQGGGWGGHVLMLADREGLSIWADKVLDTPQNVQSFKELGFTKLIMISESPLLWALQETNPGGAGRKRNLYNNPWSPIIDGWPTLLETNDILIKEIP